MFGNQHDHDGKPWPNISSVPVRQFVSVHGKNVILSAAKDLGCIALPSEILRCAQDDRYFRDRKRLRLFLEMHHA
jgi:hypothetical protein